MEQENKHKHNCEICGKPITLRPSVRERVRKYGYTIEYYHKLFPNHADCVIHNRTQQAIAAIRRQTKA